MFVWLRENVAGGWRVGLAEVWAGVAGVTGKSSGPCVASFGANAAVAFGKVRIAMGKRPHPSWLKWWIQRESDEGEAANTGARGTSRMYLRFRDTALSSSFS